MDFSSPFLANSMGVRLRNDPCGRRSLSSMGQASISLNRIRTTLERFGQWFNPSLVQWREYRDMDA